MTSINFLEIIRDIPYALSTIPPSNIGRHKQTIPNCVHLMTFREKKQRAHIGTANFILPQAAKM